jgi:hypothetical protein
VAGLRLHARLQNEVIFSVFVWLAVAANEQRFFPAENPISKLFERFFVNQV